MIKEITDSKRTWVMYGCCSRIIQGQRNGWLYREKGGEIEKIKAKYFLLFSGNMLHFQHTGFIRCCANKEEHLFMKII